MKFRPDVEGLRAVAIVPVMIFHASHQWLPGGFVGVDIFFVISGFLISKIILGDLADGTFSLSAFYRRRIRRIFPALFFMLFVSVPVAILTLSPAALDEFGKTLVATALFQSNMEFLRLTGYFGGPAEFKPLLHTWSLAVEEQFYLFFPLVLLAVRRWYKSRFSIVLFFCAALSLIVGTWMIGHFPTQTFYFGPARAFELLIGAALALDAIPPLRNRALRETIAAMGLALIVYCTIYFSPATSFPGLNALLPCLGAAMIIHCGQTDSSITASLLSTAPLRFVGLLSYSLYIWHWPMLAFAKNYFLGDMNNVQALLVVITAIPVAMFSWRFVERPFRERTNSHKSLFLPAIAASGVVVVVGAVMMGTAGFPQRFPAESARLFQYGNDFNPRRNECHAAFAHPIPYDKNCLYGQTDSQDTGSQDIVAVWGDSHGAELSAALGETLAGQSVMEVTTSGCPPALGFVTLTRPDCGTHNREVYEYLVRDGRVRTIVLVAYYSAYEAYWPALEIGLAQTVAGLAGSGKRVIIVDPIPDYPYAVPEALGLRLARGLSPDSYGINKSFYEARNAKILAAIERISSETSVSRVVTGDILCPGAFCHPYGGSDVLYADSNHLSLAGARLLAKSLAAAVSEPPPH